MQALSTLLVPGTVCVFRSSVVTKFESSLLKGFTLEHPYTHILTLNSWAQRGLLRGVTIPAKSTRLTLADSMVMRPAASVVLLSTTQVKTEWDLLDSLFMLVAAVCLFCCPRNSSRAVSSTAGNCKFIVTILHLFSSSGYTAEFQNPSAGKQRNDICYIPQCKRFSSQKHQGRALCYASQLSSVYAVQSVHQPVRCLLQP